MAVGWGKAAAAIFIFAFLGLFVVVIEGVLYEQQIIIDEYVTGTVALHEVMFLTFFIFLIIGVFVGFMVAPSG